MEKAIDELIKASDAADDISRSAGFTEDPKVFLRVLTYILTRQRYHEVEDQQAALAAADEADMEDTVTQLMREGRPN